MLAGQVVTVNFGAGGHITGVGQALVRDWWDHLAGESWMCGDNSLVCLLYGVRAGLNRIPTDDEVLYGSGPGGAPCLFHISEIISE